MNRAFKVYPRQVHSRKVFIDKHDLPHNIVPNFKINTIRNRNANCKYQGKFAESKNQVPGRKQRDQSAGMCPASSKMGRKGGSQGLNGMANGLDTDGATVYAYNLTPKKV